MFYLLRYDRDYVLQWKRETQGGATTFWCKLGQVALQEDPKPEMYAALHRSSFLRQNKRFVPS